MSPETEGALSVYLQWVQGRYACDLRSLTRTVGQGHVFQRRFWSDGIEDARHFFAVLRYIEANPVRASLVERAEQWMWSSLVLRTIEVDQVLDPLPYLLPERWVDVVNEVQPITEVEHIRNPAERGRPTRGLPDDPATRAKIADCRWVLQRRLTIKRGQSPFPPRLTIRDTPPLSIAIQLSLPNGISQGFAMHRRPTPIRDPAAPPALSPRLRDTPTRSRRQGHHAGAVLRPSRSAPTTCCRTTPSSPSSSASSTPIPTA